MARIVSGMRFARSQLTPAGAAVTSAALDFDLGARLGVQIHWVLGWLRQINQPAADITTSALQTLHFETDALEDVPIATGEDAVNVDSEVFFLQEISAIHTFLTSGTAWSGEGSGLFLPYPEPLVTARNITHRCESDDASGSFIGQVLIGYKYVELTDAELIGVLTTRR